MDKRLLLALALSALVIITFTYLFPPPPPRPHVPGAADSAHVAAVPGAPTTSLAIGAPPVPGRALAGAAPAVAGAAATTAAAPAVAAAIPADTIDLRTQFAVFRMSSLGAAPIGVTILDYRNARPGAAPANPFVDLGLPSVPMLRYRVIAPHDTLDLESTVFQLARTTTTDGNPVLTYHAAVRDAQLTIAYTFHQDGYLANVRGEIRGLQGGYLLADLPDGFVSHEADTADDQRSFAYVVKALRGDPQGTAFSKLDPGETKTEAGPITWAAVKSKYFVVGLLATSVDTAHAFAEVDLLGGPRAGASKIATTAAATAVQPLRDGTFAFDLYAGPQEWKRLHALGRDFDDVNPYGGFFHAITQPFATLIVRTMIWMRAHLNLGYGWIIIIFGVAVRLLLWPLNQRAMRSNIKMQALQPELQAVQAKYKNDQSKLQEAMMKVYKDHGMSPFSPVAGCLPMLIPMPILLTLFFVLRNTIEFRGVPFLWLHDISLQDPLYLLPLMMGVSAYLVSWIGMRNTPPNPQTKMMSYMFPVMMTVMFFRVSAGLNLYYAVQNLATLPQQWLLSRERAKHPLPSVPRVQGRGVTSA